MKNLIYTFSIFFIFSCSDIEELGIAAYEEGDYEEAEKLFEKALKYDPVNVSHLFNKALALEKQEKYKEALFTYGQALTWNSKLVEANFGRARCLFELEEYKEASFNLNNFLEERPGNVNALILRAKCYLKIGKGIEALTDANRAVKIEPDNVNAIYIQALTNGRLGYYKTAERLFEKNIDLDPEMGQAYYGLATLMYMQGRFQKALDHYLIATEKGVESVDAPIRIGICYFELNERAKACNSFMQVKNETIKARLLKKFNCPTV